MTLSLISIGLCDEQDLSMRAVSEARGCDALYAELYTTKLGTDVENLSKKIGKTIQPLKRRGFEDESYRLLDEAEEKKIGILIGGDALSATTHISLIIDAKKRGIETHIIHGSSILTAIAETGLSIYKFGKTVTLPLPEKGSVESVIRTIKENQEWGLHTLILLDLNVEANEYLRISEGLNRLLVSEDFRSDTLTVGVARLGSDDSVIKADTAQVLSGYNFAEPPHAIVFPGRLHFMEKEALRVIASCPDEAIAKHNPQGEIDYLIQKYTKGCKDVIIEMELNEEPYSIDEEMVKELLDHVKRYIEDSKYYASDRKPVSLSSIAYAEGLLDSLKLLNIADFEW